MNTSINAARVRLVAADRRHKTLQARLRAARTRLNKLAEETNAAEKDLYSAQVEYLEVSVS